jgi:hypothetical protein
MMAAHGHTTVWGTHVGVGRAIDAKGWYQQLKEWWQARKALRHDARQAALKARWNADREAVRRHHADAAVDMVAPVHIFSTTTAMCDLSA